MLLPDNIHPEHTLYYNGSLVIQELQFSGAQPLFGLYQKVKEANDMSFPIFLLSLDWLYLIDLAEIDEMGRVLLCS